MIEADRRDLHKIIIKCCSGTLDKLPLYRVPLVVSLERKIEPFIDRLGQDVFDQACMTHDRKLLRKLREHGFVVGGEK